MEKIDGKPDEKMELSLPFKLTMSPRHTKGSLHLTFGDVSIDVSAGEGDEKEEIMTIIGCIGGGLEIQDKLTKETWFMSFMDIAHAYRPIQLERLKDA